MTIVAVVTVVTIVTGVTVVTVVTVVTNNFCHYFFLFSSSLDCDKTQIVTKFKRVAFFWQKNE